MSALAMAAKKDIGTWGLTKAAPYLAIPVINLEDGLQEFYGLVKLLARAENEADGIHGGDGVGVRMQGALVGRHRVVEAAEELGETPCRVSG